MRKNKGSALILLLIIVVLAVIVLGGAHYFIKKQDAKNSEDIKSSQNYIENIDVNKKPLIKNGVYTNPVYSWRVNSSDLFDVKENSNGNGIIFDSKGKQNQENMRQMKFSLFIQSKLQL